MSKITLERLQELLNYDPLSGTFRWRVCRGGHKIGDLAGIPDGDGRCRVFLDGKRYNIAHLVWLMETGQLPDSKLQRYDGDTTNNKFSNLREVPKCQTLTQGYLKSHLHYCRNSGEFTWLNSLRPRTKIGQKAGSLSGNGYLMIVIDGKRYYNHILAWLYEYGTFPTMEIDHKNQNKLDNSIKNLRQATPQTNRRNMSKAINNTSGVTGVWFDKSRGKWVADIVVDKRTVYLGRYDNKEEAGEARKDGERKYGFHENHGSEKI